MIITKNLSQISDDIDEFIQREGINLDRNLLRSKLRHLHQNVVKGEIKSVLRGLLIRLNRLNDIELITRTIDVIKSVRYTNKITKSYRKLTLSRFIEPLDTIEWLCEDTYPLKLEYS
jgi:hypothetical protein